MNRFAALSLELNLELSPSFLAQSQQAETKFEIKFATKLLSAQCPMVLLFGCVLLLTGPFLGGGHAEGSDPLRCRGGSPFNGGWAAVRTNHPEIRSSKSESRKKPEGRSPKHPAPETVLGARSSPLGLSVAWLSDFGLLAGFGKSDFGFRAHPPEPPVSTRPETESAPANPPANPGATNPPALKRIAEGVFELGQVRLDKTKRLASFPGFVNMNAGAMEYALVGSNGKIHESVLRTDIEPVHLHTAMLLLGVRDRTPRVTAGQMPPAPAGDEVLISFEWQSDGRTNRLRIEDCVRNTETDQVMARGPWIYNGSRIVEGRFLADDARSFVSIMEDVDALINNPRPGHENDKIWIAEEKVIPPPGTPITILIEIQPRKKPGADQRRSPGLAP